MKKIYSIAIDGPAGAGKSTVARMISERMGALYLDTGAMYRAVGLYMEQHGISGAEAVAAAANEPQITVKFVKGEQRMFLDGADVTEAIRTPAASMWASKVSAVPAVRERMVQLQREIAKGNAVIMDGRDIGTHVLPDATLKIYLTASCEVRAHRRHAELKAKGIDESYDKVLKEIIERDYNDSNRSASPMRQAEDAIRLDTSGLTLEQVVGAVEERIRAVIGG